MNYCKRLIEVDLPIKRISEHARDEKNLRKGHPWHLHIWWARRPWGACRAVALASLLPAPVDPACPQAFIDSAYNILAPIGFNPVSRKREDVQASLLKFIAEYARFEMGQTPVFFNASRELISVASGNSKPLVFDSFSGYGAIPAEAARLGCESMAFDLNPVAVLCMKTLIESVPKYGYALIEKYQDGAEFIKEEAKKRLEGYYFKHRNKMPIAYLWARTVTCEGPACGAEIPLISQTLLAKGKNKTWVEISGDNKTRKVNIEIKTGKSVPPGLIKTAGGGHAVCPVCGMTTAKDRVKVQGKAGKMGHRLFGVALAIGEREGKEYVTAGEEDQKAFHKAENDWHKLIAKNPEAEITEPFVLTYGLHVPPHYGIKTWGDLFSPRQMLALFTINEILRDYEHQLSKQKLDAEFSKVISTALALSISSNVPYMNNLAYWGQDHMNYCYKGMGISMKWDWGEANPLIPEYAGGIDYSLNQGLGALKSAVTLGNSATVQSCNATALTLPDDSADLFFTDPPYYDVVPYADLSDLCYVWLKRFVGRDYPDLFTANLTPKVEQIVVNPYAVADGRGEQSAQKYQERMTKAFAEGRRVLKPDGIGAIVFAHKGTEAWETLLSSVLNAGFMVTASWPIDTERASRMRANNSAALSSSVHLIVRPRENNDGSLQLDDVGDWRNVLQELPKRIHEWMPRLAQEGVVGADAIFACLGPALEVFSKYSRVEKANGEKVELREYLEQVWGAVAKEALNMIFKGVHTEGFEEDARLTAMWLWTLSAGSSDSTIVDSESTVDADEDGAGNVKGTGFSLEYDAARKIAQGLGAHLENLSSVIEIDGDQARLLLVAERVKFLFGKGSMAATPVRKKKKENQMTLFEEFNKVEEQGWSLGDEKSAVGKTILDRLHQAMILFGAGRGDAMRRFLVEEGIGKDERFWRLAQAFSALYPLNTDEKRWVDGVLARKKSLGF